MIRIISLFIAVFLIFSSSAGYVYAQREAIKKVEALILQDKYTQAARECKRILAHHRQKTVKSKAHYLLGICLLKEGKFDQARKNFNIILRRFSHSKFCDDASLGIADSYLLQGDYKQASIRYGQFLQDFPRSELSSIARRHLEQCKQGKHYVSSYFSVQAGCFAKKKNAEKLRDELINSGYQSYILELPGDDLYRVRVGKFSNRLQAEFLEQRLKAEDFSTKVCP